MITVRSYRHPGDYQSVSKFLITHHLPGNLDGNWLEPAWEYMHAHPWLDTAALDKIGIWEDNGEVVGAVTYESRLGEAFFQFHPAYRHLRTEMLDYAEANLAGTSGKDGSRHLGAFINNFDREFLDLVQHRGYSKDELETRSMCCWEIPDPFPSIILPPGFRLTSLAEKCDWSKVHRVLWRGFNHPGEPPTGEGELESRRRLFDTPKARRDLKIAVTAPNGDFTAFCGMFIEPINRFCYVEPVATDPDYRRMGLGKAAVLEGIRRCALLGAEMAHVGNDLPIYRSIGFQPVFYSECWVKRW
ncbi:MAG TPA: GNAT family N-acetyltransferase [Anaerolineaceae bacterium]